MLLQWTWERFWIDPFCNVWYSVTCCTYKKALKLSFIQIQFNYCCIHWVFSSWLNTMTHVLILLCFLGQATKTDLTETEVIIIGVICAVILLSLIIVLIVIICRRRTNGMVFLMEFSFYKCTIHFKKFCVAKSSCER